jgi:hypothetical protein
MIPRVGFFVLELAAAPRAEIIGQRLKLVVLAFGLFCASQAAADSFNEFISFGDSSVDSGWWSGALQGQGCMRSSMTASG